MIPIVVDVSWYQGPNIDYAKVKAAGYVGVIAKASQGIGYIDKCYAINRKNALAAGLLFGSYHFLDLSDPAAQAKHYVSVAEPDATLLLCGDWENIPNSSLYLPEQKTRAFFEEINSLVGRPAKLYSGNVAKEALGVSVDAYWAQVKLWLCQYSAHFITQASWNDQPWLWQCNGDAFGPGPHEVPGIGSQIDNSVIVGDMTAERLKAEWA